MRGFRISAGLGGLVLAVSLACVGGSMSISQRFAAIHNAVAPMGFSQVGPISEGELAQGESADVVLPLSSGRCYLVSALGGTGVWDLGAVLADKDGNAMAGESARSPQASLHVCPSASGNHTLHVTMVSGAGDFSVAAWTASEGGGGFGSGGVGGATCDEPAALQPGSTVRGSTQGGDDNLRPPCIEPGQSVASDRVYRFEVETRGTFGAMLTSEYDGAMYLLSECIDDPGVTLACNDDAAEQDTSHSRVGALLEPGTYFLVVDGYGEAAGAYTLQTTFEALRPIAEVCADLPELRSGEEVAGSTQDGGDDFQSDEECASGSRAPDVAYRLVVERPSRVRVRLDSDYDGVVAIRSDCADPSSAVACNDDFGEGEESRRVSQVVARLEPGTYTVVVDGYEGEQGSFRLRATVVPEGEVSAPNDTCATATTLEPDQEGEVDTFAASDDLRGSCVTEPGGADVVYRLDVATRSLLSVSATGDLPDTALYLQRTCGDRATEIACGVGSVSSVVDAGAYFLVVDGARRDSLGQVVVQYESSDVGPLEAVCSDAPILEPGVETSGRTSGQGRFEAPCGERALNPETIYSLRIRERSSVNIRVEAEFDSVLYVRRECIDPGTGVECNDDDEDAEHSALALTLDAGTYYVFVDGYGDGGQSGSFTIKAEVSPR